MPTYDTPGRRPLATAALAAASVALALILGEAAVRMLRPEFIVGADPIRNPFWEHDPLLGWRHRPDLEGVFAREEFSHHVRINSHGWRDKERNEAKAAGAYRIVVLGDSFTWGHGVKDDRIYTRLLEDALDGIEVLNMGLSASATDQQLLILQERVPAFRPDLVIVMVSRNDFTANTSTTEGSYPKPVFELQPDGGLLLRNVPVPEVSEAARAAYRLRRSSALANLIGSLLETGAARPRAQVAAGRDKELSVTNAILRAMKAECERIGAGFAIALAPSVAHANPETIPSYERRKFDSVSDLARSERIPILDLVPAFRRAARGGEAGGRVELFYHRDKHWNDAGHELAARKLAGWLTEQRLIPSGR